MAGLFMALTYRVIELQTMGSDRLVQVGTEQAVRTTPIAAPRGSIVDRNGYELALSVPLRSVYADPQFVEDPEATAAALAPLLEVDPGELTVDLMARIEASGDGVDEVVNRFEWLARQVPDEMAHQIESLALPGIYFVEEPHRFTPAGPLGQSLLGLTDIDNVGLGGFELQYDDLLSGTAGELTVEQDPSGRTIAVGEQDLTPPIPGEGLMLTIDRALQYEAEQALLDHVEANAAEAGIVIMMDPRTGEILTMANVDRDPDSGEIRISTNNLALTTVYEPGSVMKVVGMSGAVEEGILNLGSYVSTPDVISVGGSEFTEYEPHGRGSMPLEDVIINSSNTGSINIARQLGQERLYDYFKAFGLGDPTDLEFPNELSGVVRPVEEWWGTSIGSMPIGQGISVTPLQMLLVYNTIANGGEFVPPSLVRASIDAEGVEHPVEAPERRRAISEATAATVRDMLVEVVSRGTARKAQVDGYLPAGKTGTAQIPAPWGGYEWGDGKHYIATFAGFIPAHDPQLSMIVVTQHPTAGAYTGGQVSGPLFSRLAEFAVKHLHIAPSGVVLDPIDQGPADLAATAEQPLGVVPETLGDPLDGRIRALPAAPPVDEEHAGVAPVASSSTG